MPLIHNTYSLTLHQRLYRHRTIINNSLTGANGADVPLVTFYDGRARPWAYSTILCSHGATYGKVLFFPTEQSCDLWSNIRDTRVACLVAGPHLRTPLAPGDPDGGC